VIPEPLPVPAGVQVWFTRLPAGELDDAVRDRLAAGLDAATLERLARFRQPADRDRGLAGHGLLRRLLGAVTGTPPAAVGLATWCASCGLDDHGKPYLPDPAGGEPALQFNLSHSGSVVAVALAAPGLDVGVDVESRERTVDWATLRRSVFADEEWELTSGRPDPAAARTDLWSRKEAAAKATGHGLARSLRSVRVIGPPPPGTGHGWTGTSGDPAQDGDHVLGWDVAGPAGLAEAYAAAVAVRLRAVAVGARPGAPDVRVVRLGDVVDGIR
jgi:4'-phosphopantetheinyl transferase